MDKVMKFFMEYFPLMLCFLVMFIVQLKILRLLASHTSMIMYYGRQIEELRKMMAGMEKTESKSEKPDGESGLYEVLGD